MNFISYGTMILVLLTTVSSVAGDGLTITTLNESDGSQWSIIRKNDKYQLHYIDINSDVCRNSSLIDPDINENNIFLSHSSNESVSLVIAYPRDTWIYEFSGGTTPSLRSACRETKITSPDDMQNIEVMTLCDKSIAKSVYPLTEVKGDALLHADNLQLKEPVKSLISSDKAFLLNDSGTNKPRRPYLIKGDEVLIEAYSHPLVKVSYQSKGKRAVAWLNVIDIL